MRKIEEQLNLNGITKMISVDGMPRDIRYTIANVLCSDAHTLGQELSKYYVEMRNIVDDEYSIRPKRKTGVFKAASLLEMMRIRERRSDLEHRRSKLTREIMNIFCIVLTLVDRDDDLRALKESMRKQHECDLLDGRNVLVVNNALQNFYERTTLHYVEKTLIFKAYLVSSENIHLKHMLDISKNPMNNVKVSSEDTIRNVDRNSEEVSRIFAKIVNAGFTSDHLADTPFNIDERGMVNNLLDAYEDMHYMCVDKRTRQLDWIHFALMS
jgi:hypothetical protein